MKPQGKCSLLAVVCALVWSAGVAAVLAGCGGGGSSSSATVTPSAQPTPFYFWADTTTGKVTALAPGDDLIPAAATASAAGTVRPRIVGTSTGIGSALQVSTSPLFNFTGDPGRYSATTTVTNHLTEGVGGLPSGLSTGVELIFTTLQFQKVVILPKGIVFLPVYGGSVGSPDGYDPGSGLPIFDFPGPLAAGAKSPARAIAFSMPSGATRVVWGVIVRTDSSVGLAYPQPGVGCYVTTVAGSGVSGRADGPADVAQFGFPSGVRVESNGAILVADAVPGYVREITPVGLVRTVAAVGNALGVAVDPVNSTADSQIVYVASGARVIRLVRDPASNVTISSTLVAGGGTNPGTGTGASLQLEGVIGIACDRNGGFWVADYNAPALYYVRPLPGVDPTTVTAAQYRVLQKLTGDALPYPTDCAVDDRGDVFVTQANKGSWITRVDADGTLTKIPTTTSYNAGIAVNPAGTVCYYTDINTNQVYQLRLTGSNPKFATSWEQEALTLGGKGYQDGPGTTAKFQFNNIGLALDPAGSLYLSDANNYRVRRIDRIAGQ